MNLVHNAIKFSSPGGCVEIFGKAEPGALLVSIEDHGIGIAAEELTVVTRPFARQRKAFDGTHQGAGIGLPFANTIIELHGGTLKIASVEGNGTTVTISLPLPPEAHVHGLEDVA